MRWAVAAALAAVALAGCGGGGDRLTVSAAASLRNVLPKVDPSARYQFAGSDELAAQIRAGARPDVYAAANAKLPDMLAGARLVERPVPFAANRLVLAVPAGSSKVRDVADLATAGVRIAIGSPAVPVGSYTREVLARLNDGPRILANVRSEEPDVSGIVGKLAQGAVDAGFVYRSDVVASGGKLRAIELPARALPRVVYEAAVLTRAPHAAKARAFLRALATPRARALLRTAGFGP